MSGSAISLLTFFSDFFSALWEVWTVILTIGILFLADIGGMAWASQRPESGAREAIGWFFGNGSRVQELNWPEMVYCILAAILGYLFLGILLGATIQAFKGE